MLAFFPIISHLRSKLVHIFELTLYELRSLRLGFDFSSCEIRVSKYETQILIKCATKIKSSEGYTFVKN